MLGLIPVVFESSEERALWMASEGVALLEGLVQELCGVKGLQVMVAGVGSWLEEIAVRAGAAWLPLAVEDTGTADSWIPGAAQALDAAAGVPETRKGVLLVNFRYPLTGQDTFAKAMERFHELRGATVCSAREVRDHPCQCVLTATVREAGILHLLDGQSPAKPEALESERFLATRVFPFNWRIYGVSTRPGDLYHEAAVGGVRHWKGVREQAAAEDYLLCFETKEHARLWLRETALPQADADVFGALLGCSRPRDGAPPPLALWAGQGTGCVLVADGRPWPGGWLTLYPFGENGPLCETPWQVTVDDARRGVRLPVLPEGCLGLCYTVVSPPVDGVLDLEIHIEADDLWGLSVQGGQMINLQTGNGINGRNDFVTVYERTAAFLVEAAEPGDDVEECEEFVPAPLEEVDSVESSFDLLRCFVTKTFRRSAGG